MRINVNLATNRLQLETFVGGNLYSSVTYTNIVAVSDGKDVNRLVTAPTPSGPPTTTTTKDDFIVRLHLADQKHVDLPLAYIENQPGWTNDQAGYEQAEEDIYAAFPTGGGKVYVFLGDGGANTGTIIRDDFGTIDVANSSTGEYRFSAPVGTFTTGKTYISVQNCSNSSKPLMTNCEPTADDRCDVTFMDATIAFADPIKYFVKIEVYP